MKFAHDGFAEGCRELLRSKANVHLRNTLGQNALLIAIAGGHDSIALYLRRAGAQLSFADRASLAFRRIEKNFL